MAIAAGAAAIDRALGRSDGDHPVAQGSRRARDFLGGFTARRHIDQETGDRVVIGFAIEDPAENFLGLGFGKVPGGIGKLFHAGTLAAMPQMARKFASRAWPCSVAMLSG